MPSWVLKKKLPKIFFHPKFFFTQNFFSPKIFLGEARRNTMLPSISSLVSDPVHCVGNLCGFLCLLLPPNNSKNFDTFMCCGPMVHFFKMGKDSCLCFLVTINSNQNLTTGKHQGITFLQVVCCLVYLAGICEPLWNPTCRNQNAWLGQYCVPDTSCMKQKQSKFFHFKLHEFLTFAFGTEHIALPSPATRVNFKGKFNILQTEFVKTVSSFHRLYS